MSYVEQWKPGALLQPSEITFKTGVDQLDAWRRRFNTLRPIRVNLPEWVGRAFVTKVTPTYSYKPAESFVEIRLRPVGAPRHWYRNAQGDRIEFVPMPDPKGCISRATRIAHDSISDGWGRSPLESMHEHLAKLDNVEKISLDTETLRVPTLWTTAIETRIFETLTQKRQLIGRCYRPATQEKKPMKITKKFYITPGFVLRAQTDPAPGSPLCAAPPKATLKEVVAEAERALNADPTLDHVAISQVIRVVRRKAQPVIVETVK